MIIFASDSQLDIMRQSTHVVVDGTFSCVPKPFVQLFTVLAEVNFLKVAGFVRPISNALLLYCFASWAIFDNSDLDLRYHRCLSNSVLLPDGITRY